MTREEFDQLETVAALVKRARRDQANDQACTGIAPDWDVFTEAVVTLESGHSVWTLNGDGRPVQARTTINILRAIIGDPENTRIVPDEAHTRIHLTR